VICAEHSNDDAHALDGRRERELTNNADLKRSRKLYTSNQSLSSEGASIAGDRKGERYREKSTATMETGVLQPQV